MRHRLLLAILTTPLVIAVTGRVGIAGASFDDAFWVSYWARPKTILNGPEAEAYFTQLFDRCGIAMPADWRERVRIGSDRKQSSTARENLSGGQPLPDELPDIQKRMVDYAAPGLRALLGYGPR